MIELRNINKTYKSKKGNECHALRDVNIRFGNNGLNFVIGRSGSGKSTLLNILGGLDLADSGELIVDRKANTNFTAKDQDLYRNFYVGFIFQEYNLLESMTVSENISIATELQGKEVTSGMIDEVLASVGLADISNRFPEELSGGQKQRVAIARALIKNPKIILADEPTGNLDYATGKEILELLRELSNDKLVVVVSHDMEFAREYGDRIIEIKDGRIEGDTAAEVLKGATEISFQYKKFNLPDKYSLKLALNGFKRKKLRLILSIIISMIALSMFGLAYTFTEYDTEAQIAENIKNTGATFASAVLIEDAGDETSEVETKYLHAHEKKGYTKSSTLDALRNNYPNIAFWQTTKLQLLPYNVVNENDIWEIIEPYAVTINGVSDIEKMGFTMVNGAEDLDEDTVYLTDAYVNFLLNYKKIVSIGDGYTSSQGVCPLYIYENGEYVNLSPSYPIGNITGKTLYEYTGTTSITPNSEATFEEMVTVAGIVKTDYLEKRDLYDSLSEKGKELFDYQRQEIYFRGFCNWEYFQKHKLDNYSNEGFALNAQYDSSAQEAFNANYILELKCADKIFDLESLHFYQNGIMGTISYLTIEDETVQADYVLEKKEIFISLALYNRIFGTSYQTNDIVEQYKELVEDDEGYLNEITRYRLVKNLEHIGETVDLRIYDYSGNLMGRLKDYKIKDVVVRWTDSMPHMILADENFEILRRLSVTPTGFIFSAMSDKEILTSLFKDLREDDYLMISPYSSAVYNYASKISLFRLIFAITAATLMCLSILLIMNFISASAVDKKKEIGILRALGASKGDVIKTFVFEGLFISVITGVLAIALIVGGTYFADIIMSSKIEKGVKLIDLNFPSLIFAVVLSFAATAISSVLPVYRISKLHPTDAIKKAA